MDADAIIARYAMKPHPEGGFYAETYRSAGLIPADALPGFTGARAYCTAILYLLREGECSALHRLRQDEIWHFHAGGPLRLVALSPDGHWTETRMGASPQETVQWVVPAGCWFGARPAPGSGFCLVGCTVAPGFDFADFEIADPAELRARHPSLEKEIQTFTTPKGTQS